MKQSKSLNNISHRGHAPRLKEGKHCRDLGTRKYKSVCIYIYKQSKLKAQYLLDTLANSSRIRRSKDKVRSYITSVIYICTHLWPRTALAKCRQILVAQSSCGYQTVADREPVPSLTMPTATLQSHAKQESAYLLFYNRNACRIPQY